MSDTDRLYQDWLNSNRAAKRRHLYATDPIWRLTKLKDNRERKMRKAMAT
jgi:hypothetical protein